MQPCQIVCWLPDLLAAACSFFDFGAHGLCSCLMQRAALECDFAAGAAAILKSKLQQVAIAVAAVAMASAIVHYGL